MLISSRLSYANHAHCPAFWAADWTPAVPLRIQGSVVAAQNAKRTSLAPYIPPAARLRAAFSSSGKAATTVQTAATAAPQDIAAQGDAGVDNWPSGTAGARAYKILVALGQYNPTGLSDGPASLSQVLPYSAALYEQAMQHGAQLLHLFTVYRLSNIAAALAAAGHVDEPFMRQLGDEAVQLLQQAPAVEDNAAAVAQLKAISYLAVAYARIGLLHTKLFTQLAVTGAKVLLRGRLRPSKRLHAQYIAQLAAAYAALKLHPPQLFKAVGELLKQQRQVTSLLGPQESMLLLWAFAKVEHKDPPAQLLLTQRAATQVGQLDCKGLAHAYIQCAQANLTAPPLLAALRKATRQRLPAMSPQDLTALLAALAALGQQDSLLLDEAAKVVHNKLMNFTAGQISSTLSALNLLRYRNPWLLEHASKILVSSRLNKAAQLSATQLADLLVALSQLSYHNTRLLDHLGSVANKNKTLNSWSASELAAVLKGFSMLGFTQPVLQEAAAVQLLQLVSVGSTNKLQQQELQQPQQQRQPAAELVDAAYHLASISVPGSETAKASTVTAAVAAVAAAAIQQQEHCSCTDWIKLSIALLLGSLQQCGLAGASVSDLQVSIMPAGQAKNEAAHGSEHVPPAAAGLLQQQQQHDTAGAAMLLPQVLQHVQSEAQAVAEAGIAAGQVQLLGAELLCLMQLLWLQQSTGQGVLPRQQSTTEEQQGTASAQTPSQQQPLQFRQAAKLTAEQRVHTQPQTPGVSAKRAPGQEWLQHQQHVWQLGLSQQLIDSYLQLHLKQYSQQQDPQQQQAEELVLQRATMLAIQQQLHGLGVDAQAPYLIPGSPLILPAAVIPSSNTRSLDNRGRPIATDSEASGDGRSGRSRSSQRQELKGVQLQSAASRIQQQHALQQLQQRAVVARVQLQQGRVQLPSEVLSQMKIWVAAEVPFAVFVCTQGRSGLSGWLSSSLPAQLMPVEVHWAEGLACAGWGLLLLDTQQALASTVSAKGYV